jgi:transposase
MRAELDAMRAQLREVLKVCALQKADLDRVHTPEPSAPPHKPERVPSDQLQLAFERVLASIDEEAAGNDDTSEGDAAGEESPAIEPTAPKPDAVPRPRRKPTGRRRLDLTKLPVQEIVLDPDGVIAAHGEGFRPMGEEVSERLAFRPGTYLRLRLVRRKWAAVEPTEAASLAQARGEASVDEAAPEAPAVVIAPVPDCLWPRTMADASAVAHHIVSKYEDCLPLHRQEKISARHGFCVPRGSQCGWLKEAFALVHRISAPVRVKGQRECAKHHVFVFIADQRHVVFRHAPTHDGPTVQKWLSGYRGYVLADASSIYDVVYRLHPIVEVGCWSHLRRYFWRALGSDPERASEAIALIGKLFEIQRECVSVPMPERTATRARRARPVLRLLDAWVARHRDSADPRGPLRTAITYYDNQRAALHRFLADGRLRLDNNISEGQLRRLVLGRANWMYFAKETGLNWYVTFRSLIASCHLHGLNPQEYLEQVLRLAPHWPQTRVLELSPLRWRQTRADLTAEQRAIVTPPWELDRVVRPREAPAGHVAA